MVRLGLCRVPSTHAQRIRGPIRAAILRFLDAVDEASWRRDAQPQVVRTGSRRRGWWAPYSAGGRIAVLAQVRGCGTGGLGAWEP